MSSDAAEDVPLINRIVDGAVVIGLNLQEPADPIWFDRNDHIILTLQPHTGSLETTLKTRSVAFILPFHLLRQLLYVSLVFSLSS